MALPVNWETGHVDGLYMDMEGDFDTGFIDFLPNTTRLTNASTESIILPTKLTYALVDGSLEVDLPATDDADTSPLGFTYTVVERLGSGLGKTYSIAVPKGVTTHLYNAVTLDPTDSLAGPVADLDFVPDGVARLALLPSERLKLGAGFDAAVAEAIPISPSNEIDYAEKTAPQAVSLNTLLIALITDMAVDVQDLPVPQYVTSVVHGSHASANAFYAIILANPATSPTIVTSGIALEYGSMGAAGSNESVITFARIPPDTPAHTIQAYIAGTAGNFTIGAQTYSKCTIRVETR